MAKKTHSIPTSNPNAHMVVSFFIMWVVSAVIVSVANLVLPNHIVLGTMSLTTTAALLLSSGVIAWLTILGLPLFTEIEIRKQMILTPQHWMLGYFIINVVGVWVITRFSDVLGLGIASWVYVVGLAAVLDVAQGMAMMLYGEMQKK